MSTREEIIEVLKSVPQAVTCRELAVLLDTTPELLSSCIARISPANTPGFRKFYYGGVLAYNIGDSGLAVHDKDRNKYTFELPEELWRGWAGADKLGV